MTNISYKLSAALLSITASPVTHKTPARQRAWSSPIFVGYQAAQMRMRAKA